MRRGFLSILSLIIIVIGTAALAFHPTPDDRFLTYRVDPKHQDIQFYWKDDSGQMIGSIARLKDYLDRKHKRLVFATNGGMYQPDHSPAGLFIQKQIVIRSLDTTSGEGNFYLKPNGVLSITNDNEAAICSTKDFINDPRIRFATQSGPMLLIDGRIHPAFKKGSPNINIRNGVGILPDKRLVFAMSKEAVNLYDFANYFKGLGCLNALYLDGFVSRTYLPEKKWMQTDGDFGVMIGVTTPE